MTTVQIERDLVSSPRSEATLGEVSPQATEGVSPLPGFAGTPPAGGRNEEVARRAGGGLSS